jgi:hypothetical protein
VDVPDLVPVATVPAFDTLPVVARVDVADPVIFPVPALVAVVVPTKPIPLVPLRMRVVGTYPVMVEVAVTVAETGCAAVA